MITVLGRLFVLPSQGTTVKQMTKTDQLFTPLILLFLPFKSTKIYSHLGELMLYAPVLFILRVVGLINNNMSTFFLLSTDSVIEIYLEIFSTHSVLNVDFISKVRVWVLQFHCLIVHGWTLAIQWLFIKRCITYMKNYYK